MTNWKDTASKGVKLWAPPLPPQEGPVEAASKRLSRPSIDAKMAERDHNLAAEPSILHSKLAIFHELFGTPSSPPTVNTFVTTPQSLFSPDPSERHSTRSNSLPSSVDTNFTDYDFPPTPESPCAAKGRNYSHRQKGRTRHYLEEEQIHKNSSTVKLDFGRNMGKTAAPEYSPSHRWTYKEREMLCCLWRWHARDPIAFTQIFNHVFEQRLSIRKVRCQFENYLRLHGPDAFLVYRDVFSSPFEPRGKYAAILKAIDIAAREIGIKIQRFQEEYTFRSGEAQSARSPKTRRLYRSLVRRASQDRRISAMYTQTQTEPPARIPALGNIAMTTDAKFEESEHITDAEDHQDPHDGELEKMSTDAPRISFRVWDSNSRTLFSSADGFVSEVFKSWNGPFPEPFKPEGAGKQAIRIFLNTHFSFTGGSSAFISSTTSLLQALCRASNMSKPHLAVVLIDTLTTEPFKTIPAAEALKDLKSNGQARWARRYKGKAECITWAQIPASAIATTLPLANLITLYEQDEAVAKLLHLHEFTSGRRTLELSNSLREKAQAELTPSTSAAIGRVAKLFGLDSLVVSLHHISAFVARIVDGWNITDNVSSDINDISFAFAEALQSQAYSHQDIMGAYLAGIKEGNETLAYFARRRRPAARRGKSA